MRKTLNINLGGMAFIIDENAYELLHNYLEALKQKFNNAAERDEIMSDIEGRIAEMLGQKLADRKEVISIEEVQAIIDVMGKPEDIAGDDTDTATTTNSTTNNSTTASGTTTQQQVKKRLYRDPDDAKVAGVIAGLCHYFGIADPIWVRIAAIVLIFFTSGSIIPLYLLLIFIIPKANTAAEKLQMKGEPVNINTIEKEIRDAASRAGESVNKFVKDQNFFERLWDILLSVLKVFLKLFAVVDIVVAMFCLIVVAICFVVFYVLGTSAYSEASRILVDSPSTVTLFSFGFLFALAAPLIAFIYLGLKILLGQRSRMRWLKTVLLVLWAVGLVLLTMSGIKTISNFKTEGVNKQTNVLMQPANGTLFVQLTDSSGKKVSREDEEDYRGFNIDEDGVFVNGVSFKDIGLIPVGKPELQLVPSENDSFYIQEIITSKGSDRNSAVKNAEMVIYKFAQTDTVLNLNPHIYIGKEAKWRNQSMKLRLAIPEGKKVRFADNIDIWAAIVKGDETYNDTQFANTVWTVNGGKVKCIAGENHASVEKDDNKGDEDTDADNSKTEAKPGKQKKDSGDNDSGDDKKDDKNRDF